MTKTEFANVLKLVNNSKFDDTELIFDFLCEDPIGHIIASKDRIKISNDLVFICNELNPTTSVISVSSIREITVGTMKSNKITSQVNMFFDNLLIPNGKAATSIFNYVDENNIDAESQAPDKEQVKTTSKSKKS